MRYYVAGDFIYVAGVPLRNKKLAPRWIGPYRVISTEHFPLLSIEREGKVEVVHHDRVKICVSNRLNEYYNANRQPGVKVGIKLRKRKGVREGDDNADERENMEENLDEEGSEIERGDRTHYSLRTLPRVDYKM